MYFKPHANGILGCFQPFFTIAKCKEEIRGPMFWCLCVPDMSHPQWRHWTSFEKTCLVIKVPIFFNKRYRQVLNFKHGGPLTLNKVIKKKKHGDYHIATLMKETYRGNVFFLFAMSLA